MKKRIFGLLMVVIMMFAMVACGSKTDTATTDQSSTKTTEATQDSEAAKDSEATAETTEDKKADAIENESKDVAGVEADEDQISVTE